MKEKKAVASATVVAKATGTSTKFKPPKTKEIKETAEETTTKEKAKRPKKKKKVNKGGSNNKEEVKEVEDNPTDGTPSKTATKSRDFSTDLLHYLSQWSHKDEVVGAWKFNKILQNWALEQCFDDSSINAELFTRLLPYLASIQGSALERLLNRAETIIENASNDESTGNDPNTAVSEIALKRALKIRTKCLKTNLPHKNR